MYVSGAPAGGEIRGVTGDENASTSREAMAELGREFEGILLASMLKESLKNSAKTAQSEEDGASNAYMEMAFEQIAYYVGRQGLLGITDQLLGTNDVDPRTADE